MTVTIELEQMEFHAYHGCYDLEKVVGNHFGVDVKFEAEVGDAAAKDSLEQTINYVSVYEIVKKEMAIKSNTVENVAFRTATAIRENFPQITKVWVKVAKYAPPVAGKMKNVAVTVVR